MDNTLLNVAKDFTLKHGNNINKDQFFLIDGEAITRFVDSAGVTKEDIVLEVGPGLGFVTQPLSKVAKKVIAIEIDERFKPYLKKLSTNVQIIYGDAYKLINDHQFRRSIASPTKVVSSIPYSRAQNMLHNYTNYAWYQGDLYWICPLSLADKVNSEAILSAYFKAEIIEIIPKESFFPQPGTTSAMIHFARIPDPIATGSFDIYIRRWLYNHEDWKVKNALREAIIMSAKELKSMTVTKNMARELIQSLNIPDNELEELTNNLRPQYYYEVSEKLGNWFNTI